MTMQLFVLIDHVQYSAEKTSIIWNKLIRKTTKSSWLNLQNTTDPNTKTSVCFSTPLPVIKGCSVLRKHSMAVVNMSHLKYERFTFYTPWGNAWLGIKCLRLLCSTKHAVSYPRRMKQSSGQWCLSRGCTSQLSMGVCVLRWKTVKRGCTMWLVAWQHWRDLSTCCFYTTHTHT